MIDHLLVLSIALLAASVGTSLLPRRAEGAHSHSPHAPVQAQSHTLPWGGTQYHFSPMTFQAGSDDTLTVTYTVTINEQGNATAAVATSRDSHYIALTNATQDGGRQ